MAPETGFNCLAEAVPAMFILSLLGAKSIPRRIRWLNSIFSNALNTLAYVLTGKPGG
jgi:hypothetical protein